MLGSHYSLFFAVSELKKTPSSHLEASLEYIEVLFHPVHHCMVKYIATGCCQGQKYERVKKGVGLIHKGLVFQWLLNMTASMQSPVQKVLKLTNKVSREKVYFVPVLS